MNKTIIDMKKILLMVIATFMAMSASAQDTVKVIRVYEGDNIVFEQDYSTVDSVVFTDVVYSASSSDPNTPLSGLSEAVKNIIGCTWKVYNSSTKGYTYFIFSKNNHLYMVYENRNGYRENYDKGDWIYNETTGKLITTISDYSWDMNIITPSSMQGTMFGGGSTGFSFSHADIVDLKMLPGEWAGAENDNAGITLKFKNDSLSIYENGELKETQPYGLQFEEYDKGSWSLNFSNYLGIYTRYGSLFDEFSPRERIKIVIKNTKKDYDWDAEGITTNFLSLKRIHYDGMMVYTDYREKLSGLFQRVQ